MAESSENIHQMEKNYDVLEGGLDQLVQSSSSSAGDKNENVQKLVHMKHSAKREIYLEEEERTSPRKPWWNASILFSPPILFGTWDGVFSSCIINMFGVVVFIRTGWMVGNAGVGLSILIIMLTEVVALITIFSAIGICERCDVAGNGGVYALLSRILGNRIGASISIVYCFGQAVACSLCVVAFGESIMDMLDMHDDIWITRCIASVILVLLVAINLAGSSWIIGLQLILLFLLFIAVLDFVVGSFIRTNPDDGIIGYRLDVFLNNSQSSYEEGETFFTILGVFFPSVCGVLAGINMSSELKDPNTSISIGTLSAIAVSMSIYIIFALILGATCKREHLQKDYMIADKISATRVFWIIGLYELSLSSAVGNIYGPPHILQGIASDHIIKILDPLADGTGPRRIPIFASLALAGISFGFIFVGQLNTLGPILTMPFLLTYAAVDYSHFVLITTLEYMQKSKETTSCITTDDLFQNEDDKSSLKKDYQLDYGSTRISNPNGEEIQNPAELGNGTVNLDRLICDKDVNHRRNLAFTDDDNRTNDASEAVDQGRRPSVVTTTSCEANERRESSNYHRNLHPMSFFSNRWLSLLGAFVSIIAMFGIQWEYALANIGAAVLLWFCIGLAHKGFNPGIGEYGLLTLIYDNILKICNRSRYNKLHPTSGEQVIITGNDVNFETRTDQISDENEDFASRDKYHRAEISHLTFDTS